MAAYAALVSLMNLIDQIQNHPRPPITLDNEQAQSLTQKIASLQDFIEAYNLHEDNQELERLRGRIADVAYVAEDIIESCIVDQIQARSTSTDDHGKDIRSVDLYQVQHQESYEKKKNMSKRLQKLKPYFVSKSHPQSTSHWGNTSLAESNQSPEKAAEDVIVKISSVDLYEGLHKVIQDMDSITKDFLEIKDKMGTQDQHILTTLVVSSSSPSIEQNTMVGCDDVLYEVLDKLTGQQSRRQIISISGMGGIGKTTLARNVYTNPLIEHHFDVRAWVTISKEYNIREILLKILLCLKSQGESENLSQKSEQDLGSQLHKCLSGKRYLIIMDDMWSVEVWNNVKFYFPNNNNRSRIIITTRVSKLASDVDGNFDIEMSFLDRNESWDLFRKTVFGEKGCTDEFEQIGQRIAENCKGLPLSIVVIGGLLAKSKQSRENWEYIAENLNSVVNLDDNERCLKILRTSYNQLPIHLKPCFLSMGSFPEDGEIDISKLIKQWVAEGFLKPSMADSLEETAEEYLTNLIERNLILVSTNEWHRKPVSCKIHDLLRDICLREVQKEKFLYVTRQHSLNMIQQGVSTQRRVAILESTSKEGDHLQILYALESVSLRSLICHFEGAIPLRGFRLLRVLKAIGSRERPNSIADILQLINSRYLDVTSYSYPISSFPSSIYLLWNLQTLIVTAMSGSTLALSEFWMMPLLRHVEVDTLSISSPRRGQMNKQDDFVMDNLQTLSTVIGFELSEEVVKRIPNVKNLKIRYEDLKEGFKNLKIRYEDLKEGFYLYVASNYCLNNLGHLHKLEYLKCSFELMKKQNPFDSRNNMSFPNSLKELSLSGCMLDWEDVNVKIGSLPFLQRLTLAYSDFTRSKWETVEGQFTSLEYLAIDSCFNLRCWTMERTHFPSLEHLYIYELDKLDEIPSGIGEIPTLQSIRLERCSDSAVISAKQILEEQEEIGNDGLQVRVTLPRRSELKELSSSGNFHVEIDQW